MEMFEYLQFFEILLALCRELNHAGDKYENIDKIMILYMLNTS